MTGQEMLDKLRRLINEKSPSLGVGSDTELLAELNDSYDEVRNQITAENPWYFAVSATVTYTAGAQATALGSSVGYNRILLVQDETVNANNPREIYPIDASERLVLNDGPYWAAGVTSGTIQQPTHYCIEGANIRLMPRPAGARTLRIWYEGPKTAIVSGTGPTEIPDAYHALVVFLAAQTVLAYDRRESRAVDQKVEKLWGTMLDHVASRQVQRPSFVRYEGE